MRYSRQEAFLGKNNQELLSKRTIAIIGLGALGSNASNLLVRAGVNLILIDNDNVELSNLQRQTIFTEQDLGKNKTEAARDYLAKVNSQVKIKTYNLRLTRDNISIINADLILDCTDNLETRFLINEHCYNKIPWIHAAAIQDKGIIFNVLPGRACFNCIYSNINNYDRCEDIGILNTIASLIASLQVNEAIKILLGKESEENLIRVNLTSNNLEKIKVNKNKNCELCQGKVLTKKFNLTLCRTGATLTVRTNKQLNLDKIKENFGVLRDAKITLLLEVENEEVIVNKQGEIIFKTLRDENKIMDIANEIYNKAK